MTSSSILYTIQLSWAAWLTYVYGFSKNFLLCAGKPFSPYFYTLYCSKYIFCDQVYLGIYSLSQFISINMTCFLEFNVTFSLTHQKIDYPYDLTYAAKLIIGGGEWPVGWMISFTTMWPFPQRGHIDISKPVNSNSTSFQSIDLFSSSSVEKIPKISLHCFSFFLRFRLLIIP